MVEPKTLTPMLGQFGYLPTQKSIGEGSYAPQLRSSIPYYDEMISMLKIGHSRPSIPEYPQIAEHIRQAIEEVYLGVKEPKQALDDAAAKSAKALGWQ
jgi:multiple sugar transport system substrate-binding protein